LPVTLDPAATLVLSTSIGVLLWLAQYAWPEMPPKPAKIGILVCALIAAGSVAWIVFGGHGDETSLQGAGYEGHLLPGSEPSPQTNCTKRPSDMFIFLGTQGIVTYEPIAESTYPIIRMKRHDLLTLERSPEGVTISAKVRDEDGRVLQIRHGKFTLNPKGRFRVERSSDRHTLAVYNQWGGLIIYVNYLNREAILIRGTFFFPKIAWVKISDDVVLSSAGQIGPGCFGNTAPVINFRSQRDLRMGG
jgi:hypothetical protein